MSSSSLKITGIILAAGLSKRMGTVKSLLPFGEDLLLDRVIANALKSNLNGVFVVLGHEAKRIRDRIDFKGCPVVINPDFSMGQSTSLRAGLSAVPHDSDAVMFLLGDQPFVRLEIINTLIRACNDGPWKFIVPTCNGKRGNPAVVHRSIFPMIQGLRGDTGARVLFRGLEKELREVEVADPGIHLDMDTFEDYRRLQTIADNNQGGPEPQVPLV